MSRTLPEILAQAEALGAKVRLPLHIGHIDEDLGHVEVEDPDGQPVCEIYQRPLESYILFAANNLMTIIQAVRDQQVEKVLMEGEMKGWKVLYDVRTEELKALRAELENYRGRYRG